MSSFERRTPGFDRITPTDAHIEHLATGLGFTEGPLWTGDSLLFTDIHRDRIARWRQGPEGPELTTFRWPSNLANGLTFDRERRVLACEGATRRLTRTELDGSVVIVADTYQGQRINSPNDVIVAQDGAIYFSDPVWAKPPANPSGASSADADLSFAGVFRVAPEGTLTVVVDDFEEPNGLALSPDGTVLYVDDTHRRHVRAFDVNPDGSLANGRVFADLRGEEPGPTDGMKVDVEGNLYCTGPGGIWVISPRGEILGRILTPEPAANVGWGDADWRSLYITASTSIYRVRLSIPGVAVT